jgi:peroxiredoxin
MNLKNMVVAYMPEEKSGVAARYGAATMPSTFIIDPQGVVRHVHPGFAERDASGEAKKLKKTLTDLTK